MKLSRLLASAPRDGWYMALGASIGVAALWLRFASLGYSDFQGDEIRAIARLAPGQTLWELLRLQRKGPVQFLATYVYGLFDPGFDERSLRLLFAVAAALGLVVFHRLVAYHFGRGIALYASLFFATNGILVAFGRVVQYQAVVVLAGLCGLYLLSLAAEISAWRFIGLYGGAVCCAVAALAHFDGALLLPAAAWLAMRWGRAEGRPEAAVRRRLHLVLASGVALGLVAAFYLPYSLAVTSDQTTYWHGLVSGEDLPSTTYFATYNPDPALALYLALAAFGAYRLWSSRRAASFLLAAWLVPPLIAMELLVAQPKIHVFTYLVPGFVLLGAGFEAIEERLAALSPRLGRLAARGAVFGVLLFTFGQSHTLFVDHRRGEYPTESKRFLGRTLTGDRVALLGFPHRRHWREIAAFFEGLPDSDGASCATNEKLAIAAFYLPTCRWIDERTGGPAPPFYAMVIARPTSWRQELLGSDQESWTRRGRRLASFRDDGGEIVAAIYRVDAPI